MGLTIHYKMTVPNKWSIATVRKKLEALRQSCLDLPVEKVSELQEFTGDECQLGEDKNEPYRWAKTQAARHLESPWDPSNPHFQPPHHALLFTVNPAPGCEPMNIGICAYPPCVLPKRVGFDDGRAAKTLWSIAVTEPNSYPASARLLKQFAKRWKLRRLPWSNKYPHSEQDLLCEELYRASIVRGQYRSHRRGYAPSWALVELADQIKRYIRWRFSGSLEEARTVFTSADFKADMERLVWGEECRVPGATGVWDSFCKTQYANEFGLPNFLRAHMTVCAILEKPKTSDSK